MIDETKKERDRQVLEILMTGVIGAAVFGFFNPIPLVGDVAALISIWLTMLGAMAVHYDRKFNKMTFTIAALQVFVASGLYVVGTYTFIGASELTGVGTVPAMFVNAVLNGVFTYLVGNSYRDAWENEMEPTIEVMNQAWKTAQQIARNPSVIQVFKDTFDIAREQGETRKDAVEKAIKEVLEWLRKNDLD